MHTNSIRFFYFDNLIVFLFKGTVNVILSDPPYKDGNARFTIGFVSSSMNKIFMFAIMKSDYF